MFRNPHRHSSTKQHTEGIEGEAIHYTFLIMAPSTPKGLVIGNSRKPWRVGRILGEGACGTVHDLESTSGNQSTMKYAIKMAPLPPVNTNRKRKKTAAEKNADLLYYESIIYQTHFPRLQGNVIPHIPRMGDSSAPPFYGDEDGYRFIVMEKMEAPLMDIVPALLSGRQKSKIQFGDVAVTLLDCVKTIHIGNYLFVDVKPDNFMLSYSGKNPADRIRVIDLGLLRPIKDIMTGKHKTNEDTELIGTPLYASLNVHEGQTLSRRDDLEALGYVISELLIALVAEVAGEKWKKDTNLPWSHGQSDEEIGEIKKAQINNPRSAFFSKLGAGGNAELAKTMRLYFKEVRGLGFKEKPDYEKLESLLRDLVIARSGTAKTTAKKSNSNGATKRDKVLQIDLTEEASSSKNSNTKQKATPVDMTKTRSTRAERALRRSAQVAARGTKRSSAVKDKVSPKSRRVVEIDDNDDDSTLYHDAEEDNPHADEYEFAQKPADPMDVDEDFQSCAEDDNEMDWVEVVDENDVPSAAKTKSRQGVNIVFLDGPHQGAAFSLTKDTAETFVLGTNPRPKSGESFRLTDDDDVDSSHAKFVLHATKQLCSVKVTDLKSSSGTFVNGQKIPKGKDRQAFVNDKITLGHSTMQIRKFSLQNDALSNKKAPAHANISMKQSTSKKKTSAVAKSSTKTIKEAKLSGPGVRLAFIEGPYKDQFFFLEKNSAPNFTLGTKPQLKSSDAFDLGKDKSADESHAKLELSVERKLCTVKVTDLKSTGGTFVNGQMIPKGKKRQAFINDKIRIGESVIRIKAT